MREALPFTFLLLLYHHQLDLALTAWRTPGGTSGLFLSVDDAQRGHSAHKYAAMIALMLLSLQGLLRLLQYRYWVFF